MSTNKTIKMLESIGNIDSFSNYNIELNKKFKDCSLKSLIRSLKLKQNRLPTEYLDELYQKYPYENYEQEDYSIKEEEIAKLIENQIKMNNQNQSSNINLSKSSIYEHNNRFNKNSNKKLIGDDSSPDPFRYSPNYKYLYKNVPSVIMAPSKIFNKEKQNERITLNKTQKKKNLSQADSIMVKNNYKESKTIEKNKSFDKNSIIEKKILDNNDRKKNVSRNDNNKEDAYFRELKKDSLSLPLITTTNIVGKMSSSSKKLNTESSEKNNHALRFSKYLARKDNFSGSTNEISYFNSDNYYKNPKCAVNYRKMSSRKKNYIIYNNLLDVPGFGRYNPRYNVIEKNPTNVFISAISHGHKDIDKRRYLLIKMLGSYNKLGKEFKCVDNDKLCNDNKIIRQQLIMKYNKNLD